MINKLDIAREAYQDSLFYRSILEKTREGVLPDNWESLPIIDKKDMVMSPDLLIVPKQYGRLKPDEVISECTSGSTGMCLDIVWSRPQMTASMLPLWALRKRYYQTRPGDRFCYFYTMHNPMGSENPYEQTENTLGISKLWLCEETIDEIYDRIVAFDPEWMLLQPSAAMILARYIAEYEVPELTSLRYIELSGEMIAQNQIQFLKSVFGCDCANQYGANEVNSIAYMCPAGHMHVMESNVYVECVDEEGVPTQEEGELVVTSLHNRVMPFIRYKIGDYGKIRSTSCTYSSAPEIVLTRGRSNDYILCEDGDVLSAYHLVRVFGCIAVQVDGTVYQYQAVQEDYREFTIYCVTDISSDCLEDCFMKSLQSEYLKGSHFTFQYMDRLLPEKRTGKLAAFRWSRQFYEKIQREE